MKKKNNNSLSKNFLSITLLPLLLLGIVITCFHIYDIKREMEKEVHQELKNLSQIAVESIDRLYPGEYSKHGSDDALLFTKGDTILNNNSDLLDSFKEYTNAEYTLFYEDLRIITTITDQEGNRITGTVANKQIYDAVSSSPSEMFYNNISIYGKSYYAYYQPLYNDKQQYIGMFATVLPAKHVNQTLFHSTIPSLLLAFFAMLLAGIYTQRRSTHLLSVIQKLDHSLLQVSKGELSNTVPVEALARKDELGQIAHSIVTMQTSLRTLIELDALTQINNRRSGQQKLDRVVSRATEEGLPYSVAIGDIDFFKKFNDTYGHDCGDMVLQSISHILNDTIKNCGFCARWGGEEFLLVFINQSMESSLEIMNEMIEKIRNHEMDYRGTILHITMTFGLANGTGISDADSIVKTADTLLYNGKNAGRNRIIY